MKLILTYGNFNPKKNDIMESYRFVYQINMFNGRWLVTVALQYLFLIPPLRELTVFRALRAGLRAGYRGSFWITEERCDAKTETSGRS